MARALEGPDPAGTVARASDKAAALRSLLGAPGVALVVLDDARNAFVLGRAREAVPDGAALLVTSRRRHPGYRRVSVEPLPLEAGRALLELHAGRPLGEVGAEIAARLAGHPFALRVAGLRAAREPEAGLGAQLREGPLALRSPPDQAEPGRGSVSALLDSTAQQVSDPAYEALMALGSLFVPSVTPELLARMLRREVDACEEALFELQAWGLAERRVESGSDTVRYRTHDLVFEFARQTGNLRAATTVRAAVAYARAFEDQLAALDAELPNLLASAGEAARAGDRRALIDLMGALAVDGPYLASRGHSPRSLALLALAADAAEESGLPREAHHLLTKLGNARRELGADHRAALAAYLRALALARQLGDPDREAILSALVGITLVLQGDAGADEHLRRAHDLARRRGTPETLLHVLQNLGGAAGTRGDYESAHRYSEEAVAAARRLGPTGAGVGETLAYALLNLGEARRDLGRPADALAPLEEALALAQGAEAGLLEGFALQALGEALHDMGRRPAAAARFAAAAERYARQHAGPELAKLRRLLERGGYDREAAAVDPRSAAVTPG